MRAHELEKVIAEQRIFRVIAIDCDNQIWDIWDRKPNGFDRDETLRGWTIEEKVCYFLSEDDPYYRTMNLDEFIRNGLPASPETK